MYYPMLMEVYLTVVRKKIWTFTVNIRRDVHERFMPEYIEDACIKMIGSRKVSIAPDYNKYSE